MANTGLNAPYRDSFRGKIRQLCTGGMRFVKCPIETADFVDAHNSFIPKDLMDSIDVVERYHGRMRAHRSGMAEYLIDTGDGPALWLRVAAGDSCFHDWPALVSDDWRVGQSGKDSIIGRPAGRHKVIPAGLYESKIGPDKFAELVQWGTDCITMEKDIIEVINTFESVITMANTIGQLSRMVPDLLRYAPADLRLGLSSQQKQSRLPAEWITFDKQRVERMLELLAKLHLLNSIEGSGLQHGAPCVGGYGFTWAHTLELERK